MIVARQKRNENIAEYILYMWQIEDIIRALEFDEVKIKGYVDQGYRLEPEMMEQVFIWYVMLANTMEENGVKEKGHLKMLDELMADLEELSENLLKEPSQTLYSSVYFQTLPSIIQLRELSGGKEMGIIETCFVGIYGFLTLKAKGEEVSEETTASIQQFSTFLAMLADRFRSVEEGELTLDTVQKEDGEA